MSRPDRIACGATTLLGRDRITATSGILSWRQNKENPEKSHPDRIHNTTTLLSRTNNANNKTNNSANNSLWVSAKVCALSGEIFQ